MKLPTRSCAHMVRSDPFTLLLKFPTRCSQSANSAFALSESAILCEDEMNTGNYRSLKARLEDLFTADQAIAEPEGIISIGGR